MLALDADRLLLVDLDPWNRPAGPNYFPDPGSIESEVFIGYEPSLNIGSIKFIRIDISQWRLS